MNDDTPQRDRPVEWSAGDRKIGRDPTGPQVWSPSSRAIPGDGPRCIRAEDRRIGRPVEPEIAGQEPPAPASSLERSRPRGRRRRREAPGRPVRWRDDTPEHP